MSNPLLSSSDLPAFADIRPRHVEPAIDEILADNRNIIQSLTEKPDDHDWASLMDVMEEMEHRLERAWSPVSHLNAVMNNEALREAYNACLSKLTDYASEIGQNQKLFAAVASLDRRHGSEFNPAQRKLMDNVLRDFRLAGVALPEEKRNELKSLLLELSTLQARFEENLLDATNAWSCVIEDESRLAGVPEQALRRAAAEAEKREHKGWWFGLDFPSYYAVIAHADDAALREQFHEAWVTRASDQGPNAGSWDNGPVMERILDLRHRVACLLEFPNFADYSLATKMAETTEQVMSFLQDLANRSHPVAKREFAELEELAGRPLQPWDVAYYSEKLQKKNFEISDEELRPYFPADRALGGLFDVCNKIYGIDIEKQEVTSSWHKDVEMYVVRDASGELLGQFYVDLYARDHKRGGAWMDECIGRKRLGDEVRTPVAYLVCNFMPPTGDTPGLLTHGEIVTLFHEFGHTLHLLLTQVNYPSIAGINGVPWDAVELPSQFMENFVWSERVVPMISGHFETGDALPQDKFERLLGTRDFQAGMQMVRQLEFALFDMRIHLEYGNGTSLSEIHSEVRDMVAVTPVTEHNRFANGFAHVFGGGYAAGYYSYKWAEVLSADAFSAFEENGIFNADTGDRFRRKILEIGGSVDIGKAFVEFRGREPELDALLRHTGIEHAA